MKRKTLSSLIIIVLMVIFLTSCGCGKINYKTYNEVKTELDKIYIQDETNGIQKREAKTVELVCLDAKNLLNEYINEYVQINKLSEGNIVLDKIQYTKDTFETNLLDIKNSDIALNEKIKAVSEKYEEALNEITTCSTGYLNAISEKTQETRDVFLSRTTERVKKATLVLYLTEKAQELITDVVNDQKYKDYQQELFSQDREKYSEELAKIPTSTNLTSSTEIDEFVKEQQEKIYDLMNKLTKDIQEHSIQPEPIRFRLKSFGDFFSHFFMNFLVYPVGLLLVGFTKLFGGQYILGLLVTTLLIRTIGWPIYAKTNDMSLKMKLMEPEQAKIQEKYARRKDPESQQMMQMEMMRLYKKYGVGFGGCLLPFLQFPIFMAVFRAISSFPYTNGFAGSKNWVADVNPTIFGINLFEDKSASQIQLIGILVLVVLVVGTQILSQVIMTRRQKQQQEAQQADIPEYRRQSMNQANSMASSMKIMMYFMTFMMGAFVFQSKAGLGVYWLIGNVYAIAQSAIGAKSTEKRLEKLKAKTEKKLRK